MRVSDFLKCAWNNGFARFFALFGIAYWLVAIVSYLLFETLEMSIMFTVVGIFIFICSIPFTASTHSTLLSLRKHFKSEPETALKRAEKLKRKVGYCGIVGIELAIKEHDK